MWARANKFRAQRSRGSSGRMYDSKGERDRAEELRLLEDAGIIHGLTEQPRIELEPGIFYKPDFALSGKGLQGMGVAYLCATPQPIEGQQGRQGG